MKLLVSEGVRAVISVPLMVCGSVDLATSTTKTGCQDQASGHDLTLYPLGLPEDCMKAVAADAGTGLLEVPM